MIAIDVRIVLEGVLLAENVYDAELQVRDLVDRFGAELERDGYFTKTHKEWEVSARDLHHK